MDRVIVDNKSIIAKTTFRVLMNRLAKHIDRDVSLLLVIGDRPRRSYRWRAWQIY
ncbi:MAG: hypothetical protein NT091_03460 [Candidatus Falkowbacteria bacterium]|nr:hypothetical protein [Candidatus Falkowbacteria bacterium]